MPASSKTRRPQRVAPRKKYKAAPFTPSAFRYRQQYGVIIICADEADQRAVYDQLLPGPRKIKVVTT